MQKFQRALPRAAVFVLFVAVAATFQYFSGAYHSEFSGYYDEPAHYVTGLMVRDYLASGLQGSALRFAEEYYVHYPKVGLGVWPPGFYIIQALWTLPLTAERTSVLLLMAVMSGAFALALFRAAEPVFGRPAAVTMGVLLLMTPLNQTSTLRIMADIPVSLLMFLASGRFARYLEEERWQHSAAFGLWASLAILTKGTAVSLALVPPVAAVLMRRLDVLTKSSFWLPLVIVAAVCGPWYAFTAEAAIETFGQQAGWSYASTAAWFFGLHTVRAVGTVSFVVVCVGVAVKAASSIRRDRGSTQWGVLVAFVISVYVFHIVVSVNYDDRYLLPVMPALILFLGAGIMWMGARMPPAVLSMGLRRGVLAAACASAFLLGTFGIPQKVALGYTDAAASILAIPELGEAVVLVSSQMAHADGEGMLIAEMAMRETRPGHVILRGTKTLTRTNWNGTVDNLTYETPEEVMGYLDRVPVGVIVVDVSSRAAKFRHHPLLLLTINTRPDRFELLSAHSQGPGLMGQGGDVFVYRVIGNESPDPERVQFEKDRLRKRR